MVLRVLLVYVLLELATFAGLIAAFGLGWALLIQLVAMIVGVLVLAPLGGRQLFGRLSALRAGAASPGAALGDGAIVTAATVLVAVPGLATGIVGLALLNPALRSAAKPALTAVMMRSLWWPIPLAAGLTGRWPDRPRAEVIDAEVIDADVVGGTKADGYRRPGGGMIALPSAPA